MTIADAMPKGVILIDCHGEGEANQQLMCSTLADNVLLFSCGSDDNIEDLLNALRAHYLQFSAVCFATNSAQVYAQLNDFFPELFQSLYFIELQPLRLTATDIAELLAAAVALPHFTLALDEPLVSAELKQLINFFQLDERLTDIAEHDVIAQMTQAFVARMSSQHCAFSAFVQIRLLSFYADKLNKYGEAYFKSLSLKCGDANVNTDVLWRLVSDQRYTTNERFFIYNQILSMEFGGVLKTKSDFNIRFNAYKSVVDSFATELGQQGQFMPSSMRNADIVFVFIAQFLSPRHAPSKIALDIIKGLCLLAQKQVVLIDTCELLPRQGALPWYDAAFGNRGQFEAETLTYEGASFNYLQLSAGMPNLDEIAGVIDLIKNYKPYFCITVGESITADLCSRFVPNVVVPTIARLPHTLGQFRLADSSILPDNCAVQSEPFYNGIVDFRVVPEISASLHQRDRVTPGPLKIAIVGNRLDAELESPFFEFLQQLTSLPVQFIFVGEFRKFEQWCQRFPALIGNASVLGYQDDLVQALSQFDVFLNYSRMGGGNSALYAMRAGLPILTLKQGDVFAVAGAEFGFNSYAEITQEILTFTVDAEYLHTRSQLALSKAAEIIDKRSDINTLITMLSANTLFETVGFVQANLNVQGGSRDKN